MKKPILFLKSLKEFYDQPIAQTLALQNLRPEQSVDVSGIKSSKMQRMGELDSRTRILLLPLKSGLLSTVEMPPDFKNNIDILIMLITSLIAKGYLETKKINPASYFLKQMVSFKEFKGKEKYLENIISYILENPVFHSEILPALLKMNRFVSDLQRLEPNYGYLDSGASYSLN